MKDNTLRMEVAAIRKLLSDLTIKVDAMKGDLIFNTTAIDTWKRDVALNTIKINTIKNELAHVNIPKLRIELTQLEEYLDLEAVDVPSHTSIQVKTTQGQS